MLITDYSSFGFDFLYLNKPVLYFDFEQNALENNIIGMEYAKFGYYTNSIEEAISELNEIFISGFIIRDEYKKNIESLFKYRDGKNCQRIIENLKWIKKQEDDC